MAANCFDMSGMNYCNRIMNEDNPSVRAMDLNLLRTLAAIFEARSLTIAGQRLGLSQSAVSHALRKLRHGFRDDLVVRQGNRLVLTPRGEGLAPRLARWLNELEGTIFTSDGLHWEKAPGMNFVSRPPISSNRSFCRASCGD